MDAGVVKEDVQVVAHLTELNAIRLWVDMRCSRKPAWLRVVDDNGTEVARRSRALLQIDTDRPDDNDPPGVFFAGLHWWDLPELAAGVSFRVENDRGTPLATFRTLPDRLPLTVVVGSCYSVDDDHPASPGSDGIGAAGATGPVGVAARYEALARELADRGRPVDVKLLLGDQVYVDQPWQDYILPLQAGRSWEQVASRYALTWRRLGPLLSCGANICLSEDHEYWNNYPHRATWLAIWGRTKLSALEHAARRHRSVYQQTPPAGAFRVGSGPSIGFFVADSRCRRTRARRDGGEFMDPYEFDALRSWIGALEGPGVLILGQPLLQAKGRRRIDTTLANYPSQHGPLCESISQAPHDIVVVCGDVHFGRYTVVPLASGRRLVEVVSSPMALLGSVGSKPVGAAAPSSLAVAGMFRSEFLQHIGANGAGEDHITAMTFSATEGGVSLEVTPYNLRFSDDRGVPARAACWGPIVLR